MHNACDPAHTPNSKGSGFHKIFTPHHLTVSPSFTLPRFSGEEKKDMDSQIDAALLIKRFPNRAVEDFGELVKGES